MQSSKQKSVGKVLVALSALALLNLIGLGQAFAKGGGKNSNTDGAVPEAGLVMDSSGNLYGTTFGGGTGYGTVFKLTKSGTSYTESILLRFDDTDGSAPWADGLTIDAKGNLYGTTYLGGANNWGTVYELKPPAKSGGAWTQSVLLSFDGTDGIFSQANLLIDGSGNLYGTTQASGGTVFKLTPPVSGGTWTETTLFTFDGLDGEEPSYTGLVMDASGNLYGTTFEGGSTYMSVQYPGYGTVFKLTPSTTGPWTESILWSFDGVPDGENPVGLTMYDGNLYGTTLKGGTGSYNGDTTGAGTVFALTPAGTGYSILHSFNGTTDGAQTYGGVIADASGNLYGTTELGGTGYGTVFKLTPAGTYSVIFNFDGADGSAPYAGLIMDSSGNLYGTTANGGGDNVGTVFKLTNNAGVWSESVLYSFTGLNTAQ